MIHITIEEQNKPGTKLKENVVENILRPKFNRPKRKNLRTKPNSSNKVQNSTFKKKGNCFICDKLGHHAPQCRNRKRVEKVNPRAYPVEAEVIVVVVSSKVSMVTNMKDRIVDSRATRHICGNISEFTSYTTVREGQEQVFMGNSRSSPVIGKEKILFKLTFGKVLALSDVLHVQDIH